MRQLRPAGAQISAAVAQYGTAQPDIGTAYGRMRTHLPQLTPAFIFFGTAACRGATAFALRSPALALSIILTRKIQVFIDCKEEKMLREYYATLFSWQHIVFRSSNMLMTHRYVQDHLKDLIYLDEGVKRRLVNIQLDPEGMLNTSRMNSTYRLLSKYFKSEIPMAILSSVNNTLIQSYNSDSLAYWKGQKSLRTYRSNLPIPFPSQKISLRMEDQARVFTLTLCNIPFRVYLGKDQRDKRLLLQQAVAGRIKIRSSSLQIVKGKFFVLLSLEMPSKEHRLQQHTIAEASLSIEHPITVRINKQHFQIGNKEEFLYRRLAIQSARSRMQKALTFANGGKGRQKKLKALNRFKEKRYVENRLHLYSRKLIDICINAQAGTLLLVNQTHKDDLAKADSFLFRNWSYFGLLEKIKYKAKLAGIHVIIE